VSELEHLPQKLRSDLMVWHVPMKALQGTGSVCSKEIALLKLVPDEQNYFVNGMKFSLICAICC
jgi:hypothetical protein